MIIISSYVPQTRQLSLSVTRILFHQLLASQHTRLASRQQHTRGDGGNGRPKLSSVVSQPARVNIKTTTSNKIRIRKHRLERYLVTPLEARHKMEWPKITCFGDSITRRSMDPDNGCWAGHLAQQCASYYDVDIRGFEGYNTRWALPLMPKVFPKSYLDKVDLFIYFFGHNDSWDPNYPLYIPVEEYEENTRSMLKYLNENGVDSSKIIMMTPAWYYKPDFDEFLKTIGFPPGHKTKEEAEKYANVIRRVAKDNNISYVDVYDLTKDYQPLKSLYCDGVHLSRTGAKLLFDNLWPIVEKKITARHGKPMSEIFHALPIERMEAVEPFLLAEAAKKQQS